MKKSLIIANWKMNPSSYEEAARLVADMLPIAKKFRNKVEVVLCPPFPWLTDFSHEEQAVGWGAQNVFWERKGAFTGEISPLMLKNSGVGYVIVGHSERRAYFGETDAMVAQKVSAVLASGMRVILCVGEREHQEDGVPQIVRIQLEAALTGVTRAHLARLVVAYEPVWAISTTPGARSDTPENAFETQIFLRKIFAQKYGSKSAGLVRIIYGGSVQPGNIGKFLGAGTMEGALVGGASLDAQAFAEIIAIAAKSV